MAPSRKSGLGWTTLSVDDSGGSVCAIKNDITNLSSSVRPAACRT
jgi:hypothetical protein